jgi:hypothetical protein
MGNQNGGGNGLCVPEALGGTTSCTEQGTPGMGLEEKEVKGQEDSEDLQKGVYSG